MGRAQPRAFQSIFTPGTGAQIVGIKPEDVRHQFGGGVGGPIVKDKLFFFFSYDEQRRRFPGLGIFSNPAFLTTVNRTTSGSTFGASLKHPSRNLSDAQIDSALTFLNSTTGTVPRQGNQRLFLPKIDWQVNDSNTFTATYNRLRWASPAGIQTQATNTRGRASFGDDFVEIDWLTLRLASTISPTFLNEFRFQHGRDNEFQFSQPPLPGEPMTALGGTRSPSVFITGGLEFGTPTFLERAAFPDETRWQYADTMTLSLGNHTLKFGGDINYVKDLIDNPASRREHIPTTRSMTSSLTTSTPLLRAGSPRPPHARLIRHDAPDVATPATISRASASAAPSSPRPTTTFSFRTTTVPLPA